MSFVQPVPSDDAREFWKAANEGRLVLPRCGTCGELNWFPRAQCKYCGSTEMKQEQLSGNGAIYSFSTVHLASAAGIPVPYVLALVELAEGPRLMTWIVDADPEGLAIGQEVAVGFQRISHDVCLPVFRLQNAG